MNAELIEAKARADSTGYGQVERIQISVQLYLHERERLEVLKDKLGIKSAGALVRYLIDKKWYELND